jgi:hypothetical protein
MFHLAISGTVNRPMSKGTVWLILLLLSGCGPSMSEQVAAQKERTEAVIQRWDAQQKLDAANRAAVERCELLEDQSPGCVDREYQRHLNDPSAQTADRKDSERRASVELAKWSECQFREARELAHGTLPASEAASQAQARCDGHRAAWVKTQGTAIRYYAESAATQSESSVYPMLLSFINNIRAKQRQEPAIR